MGGDHAGRQDLEAQPRPSDLLRPVCAATVGKGAGTTPPTRGWIKRMWRVYTTEYYAATKKKEALPFAASWEDPEVIIPRGSTPEKRPMMPLICGV